jgi:hypothetical protein
MAGDGMEGDWEGQGEKGRGGAFENMSLAALPRSPKWAGETMGVPFGLSALELAMMLCSVGCGWMRGQQGDDDVYVYVYVSACV